MTLEQKIKAKLEDALVEEVGEDTWKLLAGKEFHRFVDSEAKEIIADVLRQDLDGVIAQLKAEWRDQLRDVANQARQAFVRDLQEQITKLREAVKKDPDAVSEEVRNVLEGAPGAVGLQLLKEAGRQLVQMAASAAQGIQILAQKLPDGTKTAYCCGVTMVRPCTCPGCRTYHSS